MNRSIKTVLITLGVIVVLLVISGFGGWIYLKSILFNFEGDYPEKTAFKKVTIDGYTFLDRNSNGDLDPYEDDRLPTADRVENLLSLMTIDEKIHLLKGSGMASGLGMTEPGEGIPGAVGTIVPTPRLGLPTVYLSDGPAGLRIQPTREGEDRTYYCTAFPIGTLLSSTWNADLVYQVGDAMGTEAVEYGIDVILGPGANIHRHPFCGRNFEYYSEDPVLTGLIGASMVNGIEQNGVGTSVKHYVANNQESDRFKNDVIVSERAMREIYLKGFEIIVEKSQPWTIMSSYNKVNGTYTSESKYLLTDILRDEWGFEGLVVTDWYGGTNAAAQISAGNDLLEPGTKKQWDALIEAHEAGELSEADIDTSVRRILKLIIDSRKFRNYQFGNDPDLDAHANIARQAAAEGIVLLKNDATLPVSPSSKVALLGVTSFDFIAGGTGSGDVNEAYTISLEQGLGNTGFSISETTKSIYQDHRNANPKEFIKPEGIKAMFTPYDPPEITYTTEQMAQIADESDVAIITIGRNSGEGGDRVEADDFLLSEQENEMIKMACTTFHARDKKVIVVLNIGGVIETASWSKQPDAIVLAWQGGQEGGNAVADVLKGAVNPNGKLPMTFPVHLSDHASNANFPLGGTSMGFTDMLTGTEEVPEEEKVRNLDYTIYEEGIYVGYRHFDKADLQVAYPFGFGLSYTSFEFLDPVAIVENDTIHISLSVQNSGESAGKEVVQVYLAKTNTKIDRPVRELKSFAKTQNLLPGSSQEIKIKIPVTDLRYWDETANGWALEGGEYSVHLGASSRDIKHIIEISI